METDPSRSKPGPGPPWWRSTAGAGVVIAVFLLGLVLARPLLAVLSWGVWLMVLLAFTAWLLGPDLLWAWREHPGAVRRVILFLTSPRAIRVMLYLLLAYAWYITAF